MGRVWQATAETARSFRLRSRAATTDLAIRIAVFVFSRYLPRSGGHSANAGDRSTSDTVRLAVELTPTVKRGTWSSWQFAAIVLLLACAAAGCRSGNLEPASLPIEWQAPPPRTTAGMTLAQLSGLSLGDSSLQPGDLIEITIFSGLADEEPIPQTVRIDDQGRANVPLIGAVAVAGIDEQQAAVQIAQAAIQRQIFHQPQVTVKVAERAVNQVTVLGAVTTPGTHPLPRGASNVIAALAFAGGLTEEAGTQVEIMRRGGDPMASGQQPAGVDGNVQLASFSPPQFATPHSETIDLAAPSSNAVEYRLGDHDVVMVHPQKKRVVHVLGLVRKPDQFELPVDQDVHVLDAVAMAGGKSSPVADKVYVIRRRLPDSQPAVIQVSLRRAKTDGEENLRLAAGDVVSVESTPLTAVVDTLSNIVRVTAGVGGNVLSF